MSNTSLRLRPTPLKSCLRPKLLPECTLCPRPRFISTATSSKPRRIGSYIWYIFCINVGLGGGYIASSFAAPSSFPEQGSPADLELLQQQHAAIDGLNIVKEFRAETSSLHADIPLRGLERARAGWKELGMNNIITRHGPVILQRDSTGPEQVTRTLTQRTMAGAGGLGVQRSFWNSVTRELVTVVWYGGEMSGWPGLAHGGAIATVFDESLSRVVAGPNVSLDAVSSPKSLTLTYAKPTQSNNFYILRASLAKPAIKTTEAPPPEQLQSKSWLPYWKDLTKKTISPEPEPTVEVLGTLENLDGKLCVRAKALFPAGDVQDAQP